MSAVRHQPPLYLDERGQGDTCSFIVIGETHGIEGAARRTLVGWQTQPVIYDDTCGSFAGSTHVGSDAAEREALLWSMLWRISINDNIPTVFCTDSALTKGQAAGELGSSEMTESFRLLRGAAQTLAAILPGDAFRIQHVLGHSNDPLNDFVDFAAKTERDKSCYLPRARFSLCELRKFMPYMWMLFHKHAGLPPLCQNGFHAVPPDLPNDGPKS